MLAHFLLHGRALARPSRPSRCLSDFRTPAVRMKVPTCSQYFRMYRAVSTVFRNHTAISKAWTSICHSTRERPALAPMLAACCAMPARGAPAAAPVFQSGRRTVRHRAPPYHAIPRHSRWSTKGQAHEGQVSGCRSEPELSGRFSCQAEASIRDEVRGRAERLVMSCHVSVSLGPYECRGRSRRGRDK
jgi:hypothetical protein